MPVTFTVASQKPEAYQFWQQPAVPHDILSQACREQAMRCADLLQCSINRDNIKNLVPRVNGFVNAALEAYGSHHHLRLRYV